MLCDKLRSLERIGGDGGMKTDDEITKSDVCSELKYCEHELQNALSIQRKDILKMLEGMVCSKTDEYVVVYASHYQNLKTLLSGFEGD